jgi:dipeptidyl-peptidase-4
MWPRGTLPTPGFPDRIAWLKAAAARLPELDLNRVGIYGGSAGGQNAMRALLAHGDFLSGGGRPIVGATTTAWTRSGGTRPGWVGRSGRITRNSPTSPRPTSLQGKLLLTVGELDKNVDPASTYQVVAALIKAGKPFEFLPFPGAGHGAIESDYGRRLRADFFVRSLKP